MAGGSGAIRVRDHRRASDVFTITGLVELRGLWSIWKEGGENVSVTMRGRVCDFRDLFLPGKELSTRAGGLSERRRFDAAEEKRSRVCPMGTGLFLLKRSAGRSDLRIVPVSSSSFAACSYLSMSISRIG
jgi:hypothetical protein